MALGDNVDEWTRLLAKRFRQPSNVAIDAMLHEKFTMRDAASHREPREFAAKMLRSAKDAGLAEAKVQLDIVYNGIDLELRRDIRRPTDKTTVNEFLTELDDRKHEWWAYAARHRGSNVNNGGQGQNNRQGRLAYEARSSGQAGQYGQYGPNRAGYQPFRQGFQSYGNAYGSTYGNTRPPFNSYQNN